MPSQGFSILLLEEEIRFGLCNSLGLSETGTGDFPVVKDFKIFILQRKEP